MQSKYNIIGITPQPDLNNKTVRFALIGAIFIGSDNSVWQKVNKKYNRDINNWRLVNYLDFNFNINDKSIKLGNTVTIVEDNGIDIINSSNEIEFNLRVLDGVIDPVVDPGTDDLWIYINTVGNSIWYWYNNQWNTNSGGSTTLVNNGNGTYSYGAITWTGTDDQTSDEILVGTPLTNYPSALTVHDALEEIFTRLRNVAILEKIGTQFKNNSSNYKGTYTFNVTDITGVTNYNKYFRVGIYEVFSQVSVSNLTTAATQVLTPTILPSNGDLIILIVACETTGVTIGTPTGFTLVDSYPTPWGISVFTKTASGETGPYTATFSPNAGYRYIRMHILRSLGGHALIVNTSAKNTDASTLANPILCPALTSTKVYNYVLDSIIYDTNGRTYTDATGYSSVTNDPGLYELIIQSGFHNDVNIEQRSVALNGGSAYKVISLAVTEVTTTNKPSLTYLQTLPNGLYKITMNSSDGLGTTSTTLRYFNAKHFIFVNCYNNEGIYKTTLQSAFDYINNYDSTNADDYIIICKGTLGDTGTVTPIPLVNVIFLPNTTLNAQVIFSATSSWLYRWYGLDKHTCIITSNNSSYTIITGGGGNPTDLTISGFTIRNTNSAAVVYQINNTGILNARDCIFTAYDLSKVALYGGTLSSTIRLHNCIFNGQLYLSPSGSQKNVHNCIINVYNTIGLFIDSSVAIIDNVIINLTVDGTVLAAGIHILNQSQASINTIQNVKIIMSGASNSIYYNAPIIAGLFVRHQDTDQVTLDNIYIETDGIGIVAYTPTATNIKYTNFYIKAALGFARTSSTTVIVPVAWTNAELYNSILDVDTLGDVTIINVAPENNGNITI